MVDLSRRTLLAGISGLSTAALSGCSSMRSGGKTKADVGNTVTLSDSSELTVHASEIQESFVYRDGTELSVGGLPDSRLVYLYASGGMSSGEFELHADLAKNGLTKLAKSPTTEVANVPVSRIIDSRLLVSPEEVPESAKLLMFELERDVGEGHFNIQYKSPDDEIVWDVGESMRNQAQENPVVELQSTNVPDTTTPDSEVDATVRLENKSEAPTTAFVQYGAIGSDNKLAIENVEFEAESTRTLSTTITPEADVDDIVFMCNWGNGHFEQSLDVLDTQK